MFAKTGCPYVIPPWATGARIYCAVPPPMLPCAENAYPSPDASAEGSFRRVAPFPLPR
eukprot:CAMPEP_0181327930 /NCGR_PEP_ID=MMETSP1101-20121128/22394_1 /TAXON_ID=46948 /ORGANISM="Rhodomonas abbreviata, Strain Caron Lab Isolate" /LENGTH=57 /DNA_ID=CAMNT_0023436683 /DNA_START=78 /DNA_END=247 /DNA_ORIENTATION=-